MAAGGPHGVHDHTGPAAVAYDPAPDGEADPGEVVWASVPYEDDPGRSKDRPLVVMGRAGDDLLGLMLSSRDHAGDDDWLLLGSGAWDRDGRPSSVRLDRVLRMSPAAVRREGATLDRARFDKVAALLRSRYGWS